MSVGFIGAGQVALALVRGFAAACEVRVKPAVETRRLQPARTDAFVVVFP